MRIRLLGPVDVTVAGEARPVPGLRRKALLAVLALHAGEIVSTDRLTEVVWGGRAPATATNTLQSHVSYLRRVLGPGAIVARPPGYLLDLPAGSTDAGAAERLIREGTGATDAGHGAACLRSALDLWRGRSLVDVAGLRWLDEQADRLEQLRVRAGRSLTDLRLTLGEHAQLVPELERLARQDPFDEHTHGQLMLALYRAGRQSEALTAYRRLRHTLREELGIDPGPAVRDLEAAILRQDAALEPPTPAVTATRPGPVPAQLPASVRAFVGRGPELARLDGLLAPATVVISAMSGTAGVGKTALAVHWAHRVADRFPDGQLYVNLRGFDPGGAVLDPAVAVRRVLDAFGVPVHRIPADPDAQADLYRTVLAGKRVLLVLDNARDAEQVRPLLPGSAGSLVLVTSRNQLTPLVAAEGAHPLTLDLLTAAQARELLAGRLGAARVDREPAAVAELIARCARLPLALAIAAAHAATSPDVPLEHLAAELRGLDALHGGDTASDIRAVFSWSYRTLSPGAARLFRLLGPHPGPDLALPAAASLAGLPPADTRALLAELTRAHLLTEHVPGRYAFHDLLRAYATEQAHAHDSAGARAEAMHRVLDHYLHTASAATLLLDPRRDPIDLPAPRPGVARADPVDGEEALAWFTAEHPVLLAAADLAPRLGFDAHTWRFGWALTTYFQRRGHWDDWAATQHAALAAADRLGDRVGQAHARRGLGVACAQLGRPDDAYPHFERALDLFGRIGDPVGEGHTRLNLAWISERQDRLPEALAHAEHALGLYRTAGHRVGEARALNSVGWNHAHLGDHRQALAHCEQALVLMRELGDRDGEAWTWDSLGFAHHHLGAYGEAVGCYHRSLAVLRDLGDRYAEAEILVHLGDSHHADADARAAGRAWRQALDILEDLEHPDADRIRAKLVEASGAPRPVEQ